QRRARQLHRTGRDRHADPRSDLAAARRLHAGADPDGTEGNAGRSGGARLLAGERRVLVLDRRDVRHLRRAGGLLGRRSTSRDRDDRGTRAQLVGGEWRDGVSGETYEKRNPWRPSLVTGVFPAPGPRDARLAVEAANEAAPAWASFPAAQRGASRELADCGRRRARAVWRHQGIRLGPA